MLSLVELICKYRSSLLCELLLQAPPLLQKAPFRRSSDPFPFTPAGELATCETPARVQHAFGSPWEILRELANRSSATSVYYLPPSVRFGMPAYTMRVSKIYIGLQDFLQLTSAFWATTLFPRLACTSPAWYARVFEYVYGYDNDCQACFHPSGDSCDSLPLPPAA